VMPPLPLCGLSLPTVTERVTVALPLGDRVLPDVKGTSICLTVLTNSR
jgi:hypothetical protein